MKLSSNYKRLVLASAAGAAATLSFVVKLSQQIKDMRLHIIWGARRQPSFVFDTEDNKGRSMRVLSVQGHWQSASYLDEDLKTLPPFEYLRSFDHMFDVELPISKVLVLGGGALSYPKHLLWERENLQVDVVEPDTAIIQAAHDHFFLTEFLEQLEARQEASSERLRIINEEGQAYLNTSNELYDVIVNDAFDGGQAIAELSGETGAMLARDHLVQSGLYLVNVVCNQSRKGMQQLQDLVAELGHVFVHVHVIPCSDEDLSDKDNYLVIASDGIHHFSGELAGQPPLIEADE